MKKSLITQALLGAGIIFVAGCGGGGGGGGTPTPSSAVTATATTTMSVTPALGRFSNGTGSNNVVVTLYKDGVKYKQTGSIDGHWDDSTGKATFTTLTGSETNLIVQVEGGQYFDEANPGTPQSFAGKKMRAAIEKAYADLAVTPLTHAAAARLVDDDLNGTPRIKTTKNSTDILTENLKEGQRFGLSNPLTPPVLVDATNKVMSDAPPQAQKYAVVLAALAQAANAAGSNAGDMIQDLAKDLADGKLDGLEDTTPIPGIKFDVADVTTDFANTVTTAAAAIQDPTNPNLAAIAPTTVDVEVTTADVLATVTAVQSAGDALGQARSLFSTLRSGILPYVNPAQTGYTQTEVGAIQTSLTSLTSATVGLDLQMRAIGDGASFLLKRMTTPDVELRSTTVVNGTTPLTVVDATGATVSYKVMDITYNRFADDGKVRCGDDAITIARKGYLSDPFLSTSAVVPDAYSADTTNAIFCRIHGSEIWNESRTEFYRPVFSVYTSNSTAVVNPDTGGTVDVKWASRYDRYTFNGTYDPWRAPNGTFVERGVGSVHPVSLFVESTDLTQKNRRRGTLTVAATISTSAPVSGKETVSISGQLTNIKGQLWPIVNSVGVNTTDLTDIDLSASVSLKFAVDAITGEEVEGVFAATGTLNGTIIAKAATTPGNAATVTEIARLSVSPADGATNLVSFDETALGNAAGGMKVVFSMPGKHEISGQVSFSGATNKDTAVPYPMYVGNGGTHNWTINCYASGSACLVPASPSGTGMYIIQTVNRSSTLPNSAKFKGSVKNLATNVVVFDGSFDAASIGYANYNPFSPSSSSNYVTGTATLVGALKKTATDPGIKLTLIATRTSSSPETYQLDYTDGNSNLTVSASWTAGGTSGKLTNNLSSGVEVVWNRTVSGDTWKVQKSDNTLLANIVGGIVSYVGGYTESIL